MRIDLIYRYEPKILFNDNYFKEISFLKNNVIQLLKGVDKVHEEHILNTLNSINNQGIESIDLNKFTYKHRGNELAFSELSKAERVFLVADIADIKHTEIWLHTDINQLTKTTLKKFIQLFNRSSYINIMYDEEICKAYYDVILREALND